MIMALTKTTSAFILLLVHGALCQQPSAYTSQTQTKLEDIERDNLKSSAQQQTASAAAVAGAAVPSVPAQIPSQYLQYPSQDPSVYNLYAAAQQAAIPYQSAGAAPAVGQPVYSAVPNQPAIAPLFAAAATAQQQQQQQQPQQPFVYYTQTQQPVIDLSALSQFQFGYPFSVSPQQQQQLQLQQQQSGNVGAAAVADYYKSLQQAAVGPAKVVAAAAPSSSAAAAAAAAVPASQLYKNFPGFQFAGNYFVPAAAGSPAALYQPVSFQSPSGGGGATAPQFYYNSLYQLQAPSQKSAYASGVKSTTPAAPAKGKDESFVPIGSSNYRLEYSSADQLSNYGKVRLTG